MKIRARISSGEIKIDANDRKKLRKSTDSFKIPDIPYRAPVETIEHPVEYEKLVAPGLMMIILEISDSEYLRAVTIGMKNSYRVVNNDIYVYSQVPGMYGVLCFGDPAKVTAYVETLIAEEKEKHSFTSVRIYSQSISAIRALRSMRDIVLVCSLRSLG